MGAGPSRSAVPDGPAAQQPRIGQLVYLRGTGERWSGQLFGVVVADVREADGTVKVRFPDGGFKRFALGDFQGLVTECPKSVRVGQEGWQPVAGQHVYIAGTGKWWSGRHFGAVIVDVRASDGTVKIRYTDGGYKRFPAATFRALVTDQPQAAPAPWEEWQAPLGQEPASEAQRLHREIVELERAGGPARAAELEALRARFGALLAESEGTGALRAQLRSAAAKGDFLEAHRLQQELNLAEGRPADSLAPAPPLLPEDTSGSSSGSDAAPGLEGAFARSARRALNGGLAGASAMTLQVACFYWLRTTMNYQYRYGTSMRQALGTLYRDGGMMRFYRGIGPALLQGPLARFADTAANAGVLALFEETEARHWPVWARTIFASSSAAAMRIALLPLDTLKTLLQVHGREGILMLAGKYRLGGAPIFFHGAMAASAATFVGHYPWFLVFNALDERIPSYHERHKALLRNAGIGFCASVCSDTLANCLRVVKTFRQTHETMSYASIVRSVVRKDGVAGLCMRGLQTRIVANGCQGVVFTVLYKLFEERLVQK